MSSSGRALALVLVFAAGCSSTPSDLDGGVDGGTGGGVGGGAGGGGGGGSAPCGPSTCAGCCQLGACIVAPNNGSNATCGSAGQSCVNCSVLNTVCDPSSSSCAPRTACTGCVLPNSNCVPLGSTSVISCGTGGAQCRACIQGQLCTNGVCMRPALDAGIPADKIGDPCTATADCIDPPEVGGVCFTTEFSRTWTGGYCAKTDCLTNEECATDGGAGCFALSSTQKACLRKCDDSSDGGQSNCRAGYTCGSYTLALPDGGSGPSADGICTP